MKSTKINWNNIGAIDGQREGFEELVCQLARQEKIVNQKKFVRVGKPDGGKECFWELQNEKIAAWQAKYFTTSLRDNQWTQIDKSVKNSINNHPNLVEYYVAIPIDRPDGKARGKSMLKKWNEHVKDWELYAKAKNMSVKFEYWGKHELETRLRKIENEGLILYFFNQLEFSDNWFERKNNESINALNGRYTPELNFELLESKIFNGISRNAKFVETITTKFKVLTRQVEKATGSIKEQSPNKNFASLECNLKILKSDFEKVKFSGIEFISFNNLEDKLNQLEQQFDEIENYFRQARESNSNPEKRSSFYSIPFSSEINSIQAAKSKIYRFQEYIQSPLCKIANRPYLIITGAGGMGKSHLLGDLVNLRRKNGETSLFLLGENFSTNEMPWKQILSNQLLKNGDENTFLGALNAKAESKQSRILIIIDALNEGEGRRVWPNRLKSFIQSFENYPWLGLVVSIRDIFVDLIAPLENLDQHTAQRVVHHGFANIEYEASRHFFSHYKITMPTIPLFNPEFQNPLFLKLFCEGLYKKGLTSVPEGYEGLTTIINYYIESIEQKLSGPNELDYDYKLKLIQKSIDSILIKMIESESDHVSYEDGDYITTKIFSGKCASTDVQYLKRLISEGLLNENLYWHKKNRESYYGIHFTYQRFQDHLMVSAILDKYLDSNNPKKSFESGILRKMIESNHGEFLEQNLLEALSIQIPERTGQELYEVATYAIENVLVGRAFINSLIWRKSGSFNEDSENYIVNHVVKNSSLFYHYIETILITAIKPNYLFNADKLHSTLINLSLQKRDQIWTTWLQNKYGEAYNKNKVQRIIDWAWDEKRNELINEESVRLCSITLSWFLTSSNRYLRDGATKALVNLLQNRIPILLVLLKTFENVNDPYVIERLYAVGYGCVMRTSDKNNLVPLSEYVFNTIFNVSEVYPHILLRDYARGIIEYTLQLGLKPKVNITKMRPPYRSSMPLSFPSNESIDLRFKPKGDKGNYSKEEWGSTAILKSMVTEHGRGTMGYGDFGRYVFQSAFRNWNVNYDGLSNLAVEMIFKLGYDPSVFTNFDSSQGSGRESGNKERIGKKYQWIVFYELLAKVSDNCTLDNHFNYSGNSVQNFEGPWHPYVRDIDPSILIKNVKTSKDVSSLKNIPWWCDISYENWATDEGSWLRDTTDLPSIKNQLIKKDKEGCEWVNLDLSVSIWEPGKTDEEKISHKRNRRVFYEVGSWLIKNKELKKINLANYFSEDWTRIMPSSSSNYTIFSREYLWSPAWEFITSSDYHGGNELPISINDPKTGQKLFDAFRTTSHFLWEEEYDCSKEDTISYLKPTKLISSDLIFSKKEGCLIDHQNNLICFDPSVNVQGPPSLLIRKDYLLKKLKEDDLTLIWIIQGEKQVIQYENDDLNHTYHYIEGHFSLSANGVLTGEAQSRVEDEK